ncbi:hypothetical protein FOXB_05092 [Fusarium oxysporum f. sp. conglutinans Fo5176]|uniref:Uncharacterized protein n=1 Tax=Fusarium oxysporum (strain Fo5176) TaxID=660025 RepID=F9FFB3_FUSOF|nr:hypothetical protein FOXB_05092 [Fusarium oxysporum f. sp. conglutinans Fo5176]
MGKKSQKAVGQLTAQRRYELRSRRSAVCSDNKATGTPNTGATDEAADQGGSKLFELDSEIPRKKRTKKTQDRDDKIHETESPVLVGGYELGSYSNNSDHQVTNVGSITQDNKVGETIVTQEQRLSRKRKRSENSVDIGAILQSKPYLEYLVIRMKESLAAKKMETYHLYTLSLLAEIIDDVEKAKDLSHIKFRAYKGFTMAHIDLVKEEEKWVQQISHSVFAAAGQKGEGGHQDSWNQTYTVESKKELSDLKAKIDDLQKEIKDKEATIKGILDDQQAKLQIQRELDAENESYEEQLRDLDRMKRLEREKEAKIFDQQQELAVLEKKQQEEKEALMSTNKSLKAEVVGIQAKTDTLKEQVDFLQRKNTELQKEAEEQKSKIHKNDLIIIEYDTKLKVEEQKIGELERQLHEKQTEINDADKERKLTMKNMEDKKQKEKDLAEDLYKKGEEVQALQRKLNETEKQRQVCHKQVGDLEEKHSAVLKEIGEKRKEIDKMTSQSEVNIKGYQEQLSNKDKEINNFLKQVTELEGNVKTAKKEDEDKERDHVEIEQKLKAQLSSVLNEIKSPKDINSGMEHVLDISTAVNEVLRYLKKSSNETKELREKLAKAEERCLIDGREIEDKDSKFSKDLEDVNKKVSELEEQLNNAQSQCQIEVSEKIKFEQELGTTKQALAEKRDLEDQISQRQAEEVKLKEQNESLKNKINRLEGEVTTLKKEYGQVQSSGCQLQKKLNEVEKDREKEKDKAASKDVQIADKDRVVQELQNKLHETRKKLQDEEAKSQAEAKSYSEQLKMGEDEQEVLEKQITSLTAEVHRLTKELTEARAQASQHQTSEKTPRRPLNLQTRGIIQESKDKVRAIHRKARQIL